MRLKLRHRVQRGPTPAIPALRPFHNQGTETASAGHPRPTLGVMSDQDTSPHMDDARVIELIDELVHQWRRRDGQSLTLALRDHQSIALVMFGLTNHAVTAAAAIVTLYRAGEAGVIPTLARQVIELGVTAVWVELCGKTAAEALMAEQSRQQLNELDEFIKIGMAGGEAALEVVSKDKAWFLAHPGGRYFRERCRELQGGDRVYAIYRAASEHCHATTAVVDKYLREPAPASRAPASLAYQSDDEVHPWLMVALTMLVHACRAFDRLDRDHAGKARLRQMAKEIGVLERLELSPAGAIAHRQRTRAERDRRRTGARRAEP